MILLPKWSVFEWTAELYGNRQASVDRLSSVDRMSRVNRTVIVDRV